MKRPVYAVVFPVLVFWLLWNMCHRTEAPDLPVTEVTGTIYRQEQRNGRTAIYLKDTSCNTNILIYQNSEIPYKTGNRITISGEVRAFERPRNPGQFDQASYYRARNIGGYMFEERGVINDPHYSRIKHRLEQLRFRIGEVYDLLLAEAEASVIKGIVLGQPDGTSQELSALYRRSGIGHLMAVSGLHVSVVGYGIYTLLIRTGVERRTAIGLAAFLLICYGIMTGAAVSAIRAIAMFVIAMGAKLFRRTYDMKTALALAVVIVLLPYPYMLLQSGFLLSFGAVAGIAWLLPCFPRKSRNALAGLGIWLVILPVQLYFFYELAPYALLLNLLVIPLASVMMICGLAGGLMGLFWLEGASFVLGTVHYILKFYEWLCRLAEQLPGSRIITGQPELWKIFLWYGVLLLVVELVRRSDRKPFWGQRYFLLLIVPACFLFRGRSLQGMEVAVLDVGQGDGIFLRTETDRCMMIDGGSTDVKSVGIYRIRPYLKAKGVRTVSWWFVTHADADHISGIEEVLEDPDGLRIENLVLPHIRAEAKDQAYLELEALAVQQGVAVSYMAQGDTMQTEAVAVRCLAPIADYPYASRNEYSLVLDVTYGEFSMLFTGDLEDGPEQLLNTSGQLQDYDVLKVAHHGSKYSTSEAFLELTRPEYAFISCGSRNSYGHPHEELLGRLAVAGCPAFITTECGAITLETDGSSYTISTFLNP